MRSRDDEGTEAFTSPGQHGDLTGLFGDPEQTELGAVEDPAAVDSLGLQGDVVEGPGLGMVGQGQRSGEGARGDSGEEPILLVDVPDLPHQRHELGEGGEEGPGCDHPPQLLDNDGRLDESETDAAEVLGHAETGPVEGDHRGPELVGLAGCHGGPHHLGGTLLLEEGADRVSQLLLIARELELHHSSFPEPPPASAGDEGGECT